MKIKFFSLMLSGMIAFSATAYSPAGNKIKTKWAETVDPENVWQEYPRPIMERDSWENLNGLWNYAVTAKNSSKPRQFDGEILVPFAIESSLSGVGRTVGADSVLWYQREFTVPRNWKGKEIMLNFGAVDWKADVWVNGISVGSHTGGFTPFSFNITQALNHKDNNTITVRVWDPTDRGSQPRGKQVAKPRSIWYTPVTGIWQTVWIEPVDRVHISSIKTVPDIDNATVKVEVTPSEQSRQQMVEIRVFDNGTEIASGKSVNGLPIEIDMPDGFKLWSPDSPVLYDMEITLKDNGEVKDRIKSYTAMRKFSSGRDKNGIMRMQLNNNDLFQFGPLDQGWWPDGLYTAPCYEALIYDVDKTKDWGYNMIRKHIKVEPALWYAYCDRKGIIVWQDMPSGDRNPQWQQQKYFDGTELKRTAESEANYRKEWKEIMDCLYNYPCISTWVPFNEAWGQFKTPEIAEWTKAYDQSRLVNPASGGNFYTCGDILDLHNYPGPKMYLYDGQRVNALGEYGGIGCALKGHLWAPDRNWGYIQFNNPEQVTDEYVKYADELMKLIKSGFSAAVYTQTTDVEIEVNGLMTYDRKKVKIDEDRIKNVNKAICNSLDDQK